MTWLQWGILAFVFLSVAGIALALAYMFSPDAARQRLDTIVSESTLDTSVLQDTARPDRNAGLANLVKQVSAWAAPSDNFEQQEARKRFLHAGHRDPDYASTFFGYKALGTFLLPVVALVLLSAGQDRPLTMNVLIGLGAALFGFYLPDLLLRNRIERRQLVLFEGFPDALDLMTVCVEAGLGLESAMNRVADDLALKYPELAGELQLVNLELRAGADRDLAMRNLALRTGVDEIGSFVTMILQAERFGTSIAQSLRVLSAQLRTKRRQRAEEQASKLSLKLLIPLIFCIFPALMTVLMGPAVIMLLKAFSGAGSGAG